MNILIFSMTPLFPDRAMGGAQKQLHHITIYLASLGHHITVVCTRREPDATEPFFWHANARVVPIFRFKQPYPEPYATPIFNIANAIQDIADYLAQADVYYSHDGGLIFPYVYQNIPTAISLRSILFGETLQSAFLFQGDDLILISSYQRDVILSTVGRFFPALQNRTHVIYNGLDYDHFQPTPSDDLLEIIPDVDPDKHAIALYPHRPEREKGIMEVIETANLLVHQHGVENLRVLVPEWIDVGLSTDVRSFYAFLRQRIDTYDLTENFVFHQWMTEAQMPAYYSLGHVTLSLGSYVETFGNVPYESLACGTPSIVTRVGPARELLPETLIDKINFQDNAAAAGIAARIIKNRERTRPETLDYMKSHFQQATQVQAYANVILNAAKRPPMAYHAPKMSRQTRYRLAPWCYDTEQGIYHDFNAATSVLFHNVSSDRVRNGFTADEVNLPAKYIEELYRAGFLVPETT